LIMTFLFYQGVREHASKTKRKYGRPIYKFRLPSIWWSLDVNFVYYFWKITWIKQTKVVKFKIYFVNVTANVLLSHTSPTQKIVSDNITDRKAVLFSRSTSLSK
jgi:hypothetical protein